MSQQLIILATGSRFVEDEYQAHEQAGILLRTELIQRAPGNIAVVHGGALGWDKVLEFEAKNHDIVTVPFEMGDTRFNPRCYTTPLERNVHMARTVAHWRDRYNMEVICWSFANDWASGTGHCARKAREYGIRVIDYGVRTDAWKAT